MSLLSYQFSSFTPSTALQVLHQKKGVLNIDSSSLKRRTLSRSELDLYFTPHDMKRLEIYSKNMADYHLVMDLLPVVARLFFLDRTDVTLSTAQKVGCVLS